MRLKNYIGIRFISLLVLAVGFVLLLVVNAPTVRADEFILNWSDIGFVNGTSNLQTFTNVSNSGVVMTTEFRVFNSAFQDVGVYVPGTTTSNIGMPRPDGGPLAVRDINNTQYPGSNIGYVVTKITFSPGIYIHDLWVEPFFNWTTEGVRKHMALQAFDANGNGLIPNNWETYGGSTLISENHPSNGEPWLRSSYGPSQNIYSGAENIDYDEQFITELHWYSWALFPNGNFSHLIGSSLLGFFEFTPAPPTAINLASARTSIDSSEGIILILLAFSMVVLTAIILRQRSLKTNL